MRSAASRPLMSTIGTPTPGCVPEPPLRVALVMAGTTGSLLAVAQLHRAGGGVLAAERTAAGLGGAALGLIMGVMYLASGVFQPPIGLMFDRLGTRRTVCLLAVVAVAGTLLFGLTQQFWGLLLGRVLLGVGVGWMREEFEWAGTTPG